MQGLYAIRLSLYDYDSGSVYSAEVRPTPAR